MPTIKIKKPEKVLVGGDFSQLEVKTAVYASKDNKMREAYMEGKDLYSIIASMAYNKPYEECLEFYPEGTELNIEGKTVICGNEKEIVEEIIDNTFTVPYYRLVNTPKGMITASDLKINDEVTTDEGNKKIAYISTNNKKTTIKLG